MAFYPLEQLSNLYNGYCRAYTVAGRPLLLLQDDGRLYLLLNQCPHQQAPLYQDTRPASIKDGFLRCPVHGMRFHLATGGTTDGCNNRLQYLTPVYEGNKVGVVL